MDVKAAADIAKNYVREFLADEQVTNLGVEETEHQQGLGLWVITVGFSRPWTRAQEVLENIGAVASLRRSCKVITISEDGDVISMKNNVMSDA